MEPGALDVGRTSWPKCRLRRRDSDAKLTMLRQAYASSGWRAAELLDSVAKSDDVYFDAVSQVRMRNWSVGPVGLVGDEEHAADMAGADIGDPLLQYPD